jgi:Prion-inhibition and propagation
VGLDGAQSNTSLGIAGSQNEQAKAKDLLEQIARLFEEAERSSTTLQLPQKELKLYDPASDLDPKAISLHKKLKTLSTKRFKPGNIMKKAKWALYKEKHLNRLIEDTTELVDGLVELFLAAKSAQKQLCEEEGTELASDENVSLLAPLVAELDPELGVAI